MNCGLNAIRRRCGITVSARRAAGMTRTEVLIVAAILLVLFALVLPAVRSARSVARGTQTAMHLRSIHQGMYAYANPARPAAVTAASRGSTRGARQSRSTT